MNISSILLKSILAVVFLGAGVWFLLREPPMDTPSGSPESLAPSGASLSEETESTLETSPETIERTTADDIMTLRSLLDREFDGRDLTLGRVLDANSVYTRYFITYKSGDLTISGIMNIPRGEGPFPVLLLNHGYIDPAIYTNGRGLKREQDYFSRQGFAVIHSDYRNHAQSSRVDEGEIPNRLGYAIDVINLVYALKQSDIPSLDRNRIGMFGHSMGGGIAQTVAVVAPDLVDGIVLYAPVSMDFRDSYYRYLVDNRDRLQSIRERYGSPEERPELWDALSPKTFVDRLSVPVSLHHGTRDADVPIEWSEKTVELLQSKGKIIAYHVYPGEGHEFGSEWGLFMQRSTEFFRGIFLEKT